MIAPNTARAALEAIWQAMVELAEGSNDHVVDNQRRPSLLAAEAISLGASDLAAPARAAVVLARRAQRDAP